MWEMSKKSNNLLDAEAQELGDVLTKTLYSIVDNAMDARHAVTLLIDAGVIKESVIRDVAIYNDFLIMYRNPLNGTMGIYYNLSIKYDISVESIRKIVKKCSKKK